MFLLKLLSRLPLALLYRFSDLMFFLSYSVFRYRRTLVHKNMTRSFPERTEAEIREVEREFYRNLCDYAVESLKALTISKHELKKRFVFINGDMIREQLSRGQSVIFLTSHQFNWEWLLLAAGDEYPVTLDFIYQVVSNRFANDLTLRLRSRFGAFPVERMQVARACAKRRNIRRGVAMLADQYPGLGSDKKYDAVFLNQQTVFFYGANKLAHMTQYPAYYHYIRKKARGMYEAEAIQIAAPPYPKESSHVIDTYIRLVEKNIQEYPSNWLWTHNRWKTRHIRRASAQYPPASTAS